MGRIHSIVDASDRLLPAYCLVGRSHDCHVRATTLETSGSHALLRWRGDAWELRDLYSRNGTYVDGQLLERGQSAALRQGARLGFGQPDAFVLVDAGPPRPHAVGVAAPYVTREPRDGVLVLPDARGRALTLRRRDHRWWRSDADGEVPTADGEIVVVGGDAWRLHLPGAATSTRDAADGPLTLAALRLRFQVHAGDDGSETVELDGRCGERRVDLKERAHHAPLLALARARLADHGRPLADQGWVDQDDLLRRLGCPLNRLHVDVYRIRRQLAAAGVVDADEIVERRGDARSLRIGVARIEITRVA